MDQQGNIPQPPPPVSVFPIHLHIPSEAVFPAFYSPTSQKLRPLQLTDTPFSSQTPNSTSLTPLNQMTQAWTP
jgi:hypothetical protein